MNKKHFKSRFDVFYWEKLSGMNFLCNGDFYTLDKLLQN